MGEGARCPGARCGRARKALLARTLRTPARRRRGLRAVTPRARSALRSRPVIVLGVATFLLALGESLWFRFAPRYLEALGASAIVIGAWASLSDFLDASWQYPGGALADRIGRKGALLALTGLSLAGIALFLVPSWPIVLVGLVCYMA
ncbi:MAG: hypothetical protein ACYDCK_10800, partial [Thermoplasmatota archaeon]